MKQETRNNLYNAIEKELGMPYEEFESLDFDEQQRIIELHKKNNKSINKNVKIMIGSGEHAIFVNKKRGERYMLEDGTFAIAGDTPEQSRKRFEDRADDALYSKPAAFVKKIGRRIGNR